MKTTTQILASAVLAGHAAAFPFVPGMESRSAAPNPYIAGNDVPDPAYVANYFNAEEQLTSTSGQYAWVAPLKTDNRGPCPGLNAMANHGYLPHNGVATIEQFIEGTYTAFGMGKDLGGFLAVYGAIFDGNLQEWSIGGITPDVPAVPLLSGTPEGIAGSHNNYEADVSPTRGDLYEYGNDYEVQPKQFAGLYNYQSNVSDAESNYNLLVLQEYRSLRWDQSVNNNPYFFNAPFSGVLVQPAAYTFIYRFMSNKSAEHPEGQLTQSVLKSMFAMEGPDANGDFTNTHGYERIPDNWYKRSPTVSPYTIPFFLADLAQEASVYPKFLDIGGNHGEVNTFTGVNVTSLTSGVINGATITPHEAACLAFESTIQEGPDFLSGLFTDISEPMSMLTKAIDSALGQIGPCPELANIDADQFNVYPGYKKSGGATRKL